MTTKYRKPKAEGTPIRIDKTISGHALQGTPDPGAIKTGSPLRIQNEEGQALVGTPSDVAKPGSAAAKGRATPGRSSTTGLKGTPDNG